VPASLERDFCNGQASVAEKRCGSLYKTGEKVPVRRNAEGLFEFPREVRYRNGAHLGQALDWPIFMGCAIHSILRSQQSPQKFWALIHLVPNEDVEKLYRIPTLPGC
jgi:hypothetical protein